MIIDGADIGLFVLQQLLGSLDPVPVVLEPRGDDELIVVEFVSPIGQQVVLSGVYFDDPLLGPVRLFWNDILHRLTTCLGVNHIIADHSPAWLIIVILSWLENPNI